jgi:hypothetical protein
VPAQNVPALSLPHSVVACTALRELDLVAFNGFTGPLPDLSPSFKSSTSPRPASPARSSAWASLLAMPGLAVLALEDNPFFAPTDAFPEEVTRLTNLTVLCMSAAWSRRGSATDLELSDNTLQGEITNLNQLELYNNSHRGELPAGSATLTDLR